VDWALGERRLAMMNQKLQAALDELERLSDTVKEYRKRNSEVPNPQSDVGRAFDLLLTFSSEFQRLELGRLVNRRN
jgi:hypothetical protein